IRADQEVNAKRWQRSALGCACSCLRLLKCFLGRVMPGSYAESGALQLLARGGGREQETDAPLPSPWCRIPGLAARPRGHLLNCQAPCRFEHATHLGIEPAAVTINCEPHDLLDGVRSDVAAPN